MVGLMGGYKLEDTGGQVSLTKFNAGAISSGSVNGNYDDADYDIDYDVKDTDEPVFRKREFYTHSGPFPRPIHSDYDEINRYRDRLYRNILVLHSVGSGMSY